MAMTDTWNWNEDSRVIIAPDEMSAAVFVSNPRPGETYTEESIIAILNHYGVTHGIDTGVIEEILQGGMYCKVITVAHGREAKDGCDGYYEFLFATEFAATPRMLEDGSADYSDMVIYEIVRKDQKIAEYHKATQGVMGYTVTGKIRMPRRGKDKTLIRGRNFYLDEAGLNYYSNIDGRITFENGKIMISELCVVDGDLNSRVGNIDFKGDVLIHGDVCSGMTVQATGSVVVDGKVEAAYITAEKEVVVRQGVYGDSTGMIVSRNGNIYGRFFEAVTLRAKDLITCNYLMNCDAYTEGALEVLGRNGSITAGFTVAMMGITANTIGSETEPGTDVSVGIGRDFRKEVHELEKQIQKVESEIEVFQNALEGHAALRTRIFMAIDMKNEECKELRKDLLAKQKTMEKAKDSAVRVRGCIYPGSVVHVNEHSMTLRSKLENVMFLRQDEHVSIQKNDS